MNAVVQFQPQQQAIATPTSFTMNDIERIATAIARGGMFGSKDPYAVLTLCMVAQAEGKHPAIVFRDYDLIQGKPAKKAQAMQTDFLAAGGRIEWHQLDDSTADATFSHPQGGSVRITWDMARAKAAGLGGKDMWRKFPRQMLRARTISEGVRTVFPGATSGFYETGEVQDIVSDAPQPPVPTPKATRAKEAKRSPVEIEHQPEADAAAEWAEGHLSAIADAAEAEDLAAVIEAGAKAVARLEATRPELHAKIAAAYEQRREEIATRQGRTDADHGDQFDGAEEWAD